MFLSFFLDRWSDRAERWVDARFLTLLTASGRSDQSHRLAPVSITPYTCHHNQREGWEGKENHTYSRKGALTTARPLLVNVCLTGGDMYEELRRYLHFRLGLAGGIITSIDKVQPK